MEWDKLWSLNKKMIDPVCPRHTAVVEEGRVLLTLTNGPEEPFVRTIPKHKKCEGAGEKVLSYTKSVWIEQVDALSMSVNEEVTLMDWGNAIVKEIQKDENGNVTGLTGVLHPEESVKSTKLKLTRLPEIAVTVFDYLITKKKLGEGEGFTDVLNPFTKNESAAVGDANMRNLKRGAVREERLFQM